MKWFGRRLLFLVCVLPCWVMACARPVTVGMVLEPGSVFSGETQSWLEAYGRRLEQGIDLPSGYRWSAKRSADVKVVLSPSPGGMPGTEPLPSDSLPAQILALRWLAVPLTWDSQEIDVPATDPRCNPENLLPLENIVPPLRAASVGGYLPGEQGYPLIEHLVVRLEGQEQWQVSELEAWLAAAAAGIKADFGAGLEHPVILGATGDIVIEPPGQAVLADSDWKPETLLRDLVPFLRSRTVLLGNLEAPVSLRGEPNLIKRFRFRHRPEVLGMLALAGYDYLGFANNHTLDYGPEAFLDTLDWLDASGLAWSGAGRTLEEALEPASIELPGGGNLAVFAYADYPVESRGYSPAHAAAKADSPGILTNPELLVPAIAKAKQAGSFVVVMPHSGFEYVQRPAAAIQATYRYLAEAGADLILGSHPHVLQGLESWGNSVILYSLGNFLFTQLDEPPLAQRSAVFSFVLYRGMIRGYSLLPVLALDDFTKPDPEPEKAIAAYLNLLTLIGD